MKIAFVYDAVYPWITGGAERRIWEISRRLAGRGHEVHIFGMRVWDGPAAITREGVVIHGITRPFQLYHRGRRRVFPSIVFGCQSLFYMARDRFDIVDCQQFPYTSAFATRFACRLAGSNLIVTWHEVWGDYWYRYLGTAGAVGKFAERVLARLDIPTIAVSAHTRDRLAAIGTGREAKIVPNGVDRSWIESIAPSGTESDLIFVGRFIPEKHVDCLIDAVGILREEHPGIRCSIIGDGPERGSLRSKVARQRLDDNIVFLGTFDDPGEVIARMKASRVFVIPSSREGFGMAVLEALASRIPVITLDHPDNASRMFVTPGCGYLCRLDPEDIAEKVRLAWTLRDGAKETCREIVLRHDWDAITDSLEQYYRQVCGCS